MLACTEGVEIQKEFFVMGHSINTTNATRKSILNRPIQSRRTEKALLQSIGLLRDWQLELQECDPTSTLGRRLGNLHVELNRVRIGLPIRIDSVLRAVAGEGGVLCQ